MNSKRLYSFLVFSGLFVMVMSCVPINKTSIDRYAVVSRHNVVLHEPDTLGSLSVGNGEFAFTVDISGLQTFPDVYKNGIPPGTQSQWAWHKIPQIENFTLEDVAKNYESCDKTLAPYAIQQKDGRAGEATDALRSNPHRLNLALIGLVIIKEDGTEVKLNDLKKIDQLLDLWSGKIETNYEIEGIPVRVIVYSHQKDDRIGVSISSPLIQKKRLWIKFDFPYGESCHVCQGGNFKKDSRHTTKVLIRNQTDALIKRQLDTTVFFVSVNWGKTGEFRTSTETHHLELHPLENENKFDFTVLFSKDSIIQQESFQSTEVNSIAEWEKFWRSGGVIDFSECTDSRAKELERRVVLSQYLTKIQSAGSMPPQETGLTMNSWYGKFHLEMHWWHAAHFALWDRTELMERSMPWYNSILPKAVATANWQHYEGARWPKMTGPDGDESPSSVGAFIIWQQPHPIYLAELLYRNSPDTTTINRYKEMVFSTADFMCSFVKFYNGKYHLCHPLIPAQEIFKASETDDPAFELQYWYYGLVTAQRWRERAGMKPNEKWNNVINQLAPLVSANGLYLPNSTTPNAYTEDQFRRDHPAVLGAAAFLPVNERVNPVIMTSTLKNIMDRWEWKTTWGWDYPLMAMTAARLGKPEMAINALMMDQEKNTYLINGHNYQDKRLRLYLPGNGGILAAVAMMSAGWDGNTISNPGFPKNGKWNVKWEGLKMMP